MIREKLTSDDRAVQVRHTIDPGFVNHRLVETVTGAPGVTEINRQIALLPTTPDWLHHTRIAHVYTRVTLWFCEALKIRSLREVLAHGNGRLFCSTERIVGDESVYTAKRVSFPILLEGDYDYEVRLEFGTEHIHSDTTRMHLSETEEHSVIAAMPQLSHGVLTFRPLIIGAPWLETDDPKWKENIIWWGLEFYENFIDDFDQFAKVQDQPIPDDAEAAVMGKISEKAFKICLAEILGESATKDWGGEMSDHFTAHLHLRGRRVTAAFLLKGPARYSPMTLNHLGKNNDQIFRLAQEPVEVLFVQHCHDITPPVRATLRAFAVQPSRPRRYCLVDGRDSLRLLKAYDKLERALALSQDAA